MQAFHHKKVLMGCTHLYEGCIQVGSQHLARQFVKNGWKVAYFSAPVTPLHLLKSSEPEVRKRFLRALKGPGRYGDGRLLSLVPFSLIAPDGRPMLRERTVIAGWPRTTPLSPWAQASRCGFREVDILYIDNIFQGFWLKAIPHQTSVFRVMDHHERFPGWFGRAEAVAAEIAEKVDCVVYSAAELEGYVKGLGARRAVFIPNGVDFSHFARPSISAVGRHPTLRGIGDPVALYSGAIDSRLDFGLLGNLARRFPRVSFVLAGPVHAAVPFESLPRNVHFVGPVPHGELPRLMVSAFMGIIPFAMNESNKRLRGIRPLKLLEYLAAGLPVACTRWDEVEAMRSPACLCGDEDEFFDAVARILKGGWDPSLSRDYAAQFDWSYSYKKLMQALEQ